MQIKLETSNTDALSVQDASVASEPIHHGVMCEYCGDTNITGIRYRCVQCTDCDRCCWCMANPNAWSAHQPTHQFFPIVRAGVLDAYNAVKQSLAAHTMTPTSLSHHLSGMNLDEETDKPGQVPRPFRGIVICATGLSSNERAALHNLAAELGAQSTHPLTDRVTHLIAYEESESAKYKCALELGLPIVHPSWLEESYEAWLRGDDVDAQKIMMLHLLSPTL